MSPQDLCAMLGCRYNVLLAGMGGIADKHLVSAVSRAGGFGTWGSAIDVKNKGPEELLEEVKEIARLCEGKPFGVDILVHGADGGVMKELIDVFAKGGARAFISGKGVPRKDVIDRFHERGMLVASIAGKLSHAIKAVESGVDFIIVQGYEAGGHTGEVALSVLLPLVIDKVGHRVPVVAAGGIYDGRGVASAMLYGASGVWVGTRFMMTQEGNVPDIYKERLLRATSDETVVTKVYTGARMRALRNPYIDEFHSGARKLESNSAMVAKRAWSDKCWTVHAGHQDLIATKDYDEDNQAYVAGQNIGAIDTLPKAGDVVRQMMESSAAILTALPARVLSGNRRHFQTKLCDMLGIQVPIMLAGMGGIANKSLVAAVSKAGGFGTYGSALDVKNLGPEELLEEMKSIAAACCNKPFGVDILIHGSDGGVMKELIDVFAQGGARAFISGKGNPKKKVVDMFHERGMVVASIAGKVSHAVKAVESGVDFVIVQGYEGGGHTGEIALSVLLPQVIDAIGHRVPVVASGGICDGRGIASALAYGASGVWIGTRFMMTPEAQTHELYKEKLLGADSDSTTVTKCYTGARLRVLKNAYTTKYEENPEMLETNSAMVAKRSWADGVWKLHSGDPETIAKKEYDEDVQAYVVGQNIGLISELVPAETLVHQLVDETIGIIQNQTGIQSRM